MVATPTPAVPHLTTALTGPLHRIESLLLANQSAIESWLRRQWQRTPAPFYASVDLRNAGFKLAPVDTNLFPAGYNNLTPEFQPLCVHAIQSAMERICVTAQSILIVPESHTRNLFYLESLAALHELLVNAGYTVRIGSLLPSISAATAFDLPSGRRLVLEPLVRTGARLGVAGFDPCLVLLNNDLSGGHPAVLEDLEQPLMPPLALGWTRRRKSDHFDHYRRVAEEFCELIHIDPWLITPLHRYCGEINFKRREGEECLTNNVRALLAQIRLKYEANGIDRQPFVVVKADSGTYGMGIMTVRNLDDMQQLNRKERSRMSATKEGLAVTRVLIQEGVYTSETWGEDQASAEPVVYLIDRYVVGGFYRVHSARARDENLNSPGMRFQSLAFVESCINPDRSRAPDAEPNRFYAYGVIARLALLAAAREQAAALSAGKA